jgi:hypothetical protein
MDMAQVFQANLNAFAPGIQSHNRVSPAGTKPLSKDVADERLQRLLELLSSEALVERLKAITGLAALPEIDLQVLRALERVAASDPSDVVRECAYQALQATNLQLVRQAHPELHPDDQAFILREIHTWEADGLIEPLLARVLKLRYAS